jgi:ribosomal subunit interface protein
MRIQVSGKQIDVGDALRTHVTEALQEETGKYAGRPTEATVVFSRSGHEICAEVTVHLSTGLTVQAKGAAADFYPAFEAARDKMAKQLRRHKRRLKDHHKARPEAVGTVPAGAFVLAPFEDDPEEMEGGGAEDAGLDTPAIIAESEERVPSLSVGEAVMQMELAHAPVLVFRNEKGGALNVVYRREDGNIGWIDPGAGTASGTGARGGSPEPRAGG